MSRTLRGPHPGSISAACALLVLSLTACTTTQAFRLNPGEEPERYRVVCRDSSRLCERRAEEECDGEYTLLRSESTRPEQEEVADSDLSSTGPSEGYVGWRAELIVMCGRPLRPLRLERKQGPAESSGTAASETAPPRATASAPREAPAAPARVCVPAQACLADGSGFGTCDCGPLPRSSGEPVDATAPGAPSASTAPPGP